MMCSMPTAVFELVVSRGAEELVALPLDLDSFRIGRAPTNDLAVPDPTISRHQCEIVKDGDGWQLLDRSGRGTGVNDKVYTETRLEPGARIDFGALTVTLRERPEDTVSVHTASLGNTDVMPPMGADPVTRAGLRLDGRIGAKYARVRLDAPVLSIGSDPGNDLVIEDSFVSGFHCRIHRKKDAWFVTDLGSTNGTRVNGVEVREARLEPGALLQLGQANLSVKSTADEPLIGFHGIVSEDRALKPVFDLIERAAPSDETVLITGESGSGKELVAQALHRLSRRAQRTMIPLNCSAISKDLLESELFGHEKGAFTGAQTKRKGLFEEADGGTLFLDEIGELALDLQAKLLRVLENGEIRPVGSNISKRVDTRVLTATHCSLPTRIQEGEFREDLFYRINVIEIAVPPLRERPADIPILATHFLALATRRTHPRKLSEPALEHLSGYRFPGNVRELKHMITRAAILCPEEVIGPRHLTFAPPSLADRVAEQRIYRKGKTLREVEIETVRQTLEASDFNQKAAARVLGIARSTLIHKMEKYGIQSDSPSSA